MNIVKIRELLNRVNDEGFYHGCDFTDVEFCNFCYGENGSHEDDCIKNKLNNEKISDDKARKLAFMVAEGGSYSTRAHYISLECCMFCNSVDYDKHDEDCLSELMKEALGQEWVDHVEAERTERIRREEEERAKRLNEENRVKNRKLRERKGNEERWAKEAKEKGLEICPHCKRPAKNLDAHIENSRKCISFRRKNNIAF